MIMNYKTYKPEDYKITNSGQCLLTLDMFINEFTKKECAMRPRDEKWAGGLSMVREFLKESEIKRQV